MCWRRSSRVNVNSFFFFGQRRSSKSSGTRSSTIDEANVYLCLRAHQNGQINKRPEWKLALESDDVHRIFFLSSWWWYSSIGCACNLCRRRPHKGHTSYDTIFTAFVTAFTISGRQQLKNVYLSMIGTESLRCLYFHCVLQLMTIDHHGLRKIVWCFTCLHVAICCNSIWHANGHLEWYRRWASVPARTIIIFKSALAFCVSPPLSLAKREIWTSQVAIVVVWLSTQTGK